MKTFIHPDRSTRSRAAWRPVLAALVALAVATLALPGAAAAAPAGKVNVNDASAEQLQLLPRVGPAVAKRILDYRQENGGFGAVEDLMLVRGIGEKTFAGMEPYVTLEGETTLTEKVRTRRPADDDDSSDEG